jgi:hypothetical protein
MILNESLQVTYYEIDDETRSILSTFQDILKTLLSIYHDKSGDKRGQIKSLKDFKNLKKEMKRYHNYPFMKPILKQLDQINQELIDSIQSKRTSKKIEMLNIDSALSIWKSGNISQAISASKQF